MILRRSFAAPSSSSDRTASLLRDTSAIRSARRLIGAMKLTTPVAMAFCGIAGNSASAGSLREDDAAGLLDRPHAGRAVRPGAAQHHRHTVPRAAATERKNMSIGARRPRGSEKARAVTLSPSMTSSRSGGIT